MSACRTGLITELWRDGSQSKKGKGVAADCHQNADCLRLLSAYFCLLDLSCISTTCCSSIHSWLLSVPYSKNLTKILG